MLALAADHIILDVEAFRATCRAGRAAAEAGHIVTFGIKPTEPKTSYGYILPGQPIAGGAHVVKSFVEKPDPATAARSTCVKATCGIQVTSFFAPTYCYPN